MTSLLIVEDEESLAESLAFSLRKYGYQVQVANDGAAALSMLESLTPDLILLDVMLPGKDGFEVCREVQKLKQPIPIVMITARNSETDRVVGLELGADDYVIKPFSTRELEARIKAVLRRTQAKPAKPKTSDLEFDFDKRTAKKNEQIVELSPREWELLTLLAKNQERILSKEEILTQVWGENYFGDPKTVEIHVHWLRQKLEDDPAIPKHIITVKRKGYRFEP